MMLIPPRRLHRIVGRYAHYMLAGVILLAVVWATGWGVLSAFGVLAFAVLLACVQEYRTEPGVWMLAALYAAIYTGLVLIWQSQNLLEIVRGVAAQPALDALDAAVGLYFLGLTARVASSVVVYNRRLTTGRRGSPRVEPL